MLIDRMLVALARWSCYVLLALAPVAHRWPLIARPGVVYPEYVGGMLFLVDLPLLLTVLCWLLSQVASRDARLRLGPLYITLPLAGLVVLGSLSVLWSGAPITTAEHGLRLLMAFAFYLFLVNGNMPWQRGAVALAVGLALEATVGLAQFATQGPLDLPWLQEYQTRAGDPAAVAFWTDSQRWVRAYGLTTSPNLIGGYLALSLVALAGLMLACRRRWWLLGLPFVGLGAAGLLASFSRSAWLGLLVGAAVLSGSALLARPQYRPARRRLAAIGAVALLAVAAFAAVFPDSLATRVASSSPPGRQPTAEVLALDERGRYLDVALRLVAQQPLLGIGLGYFPLASFRLLGGVAPDGLYHFQPVHNVPVLVASELGLPALALLLLPALWLPIAWRSVLAGAFRPWPAVVAAIGVIALLDHYLWTLPQGRALLFAALGFCVAGLQEAPADLPRLSTSGLSRALAGLANRLLERRGVLTPVLVAMLVAAGVDLALVLHRGLLFWDQASLALGGLGIAEALGRGDLGGLLAQTNARTIYPFVHSYMLAGAFLTFGVSDQVARLTSLPLHLATALAAYVLSRRLAGRAGWTPYLAAILVLTSPLLLYLASDLLLESLGAFLTTATLVVHRYARDRGNGRWFLVAGLLTAATFLTKYNYGLILAVGIALDHVVARLRGPRRLPGTGLLFAAGAVLPAAAWLMIDYERKLADLGPFLTNRTTALGLIEGLTFYPRAVVLDYSPHPVLGGALLAGYVWAWSHVGRPRYRPLLLFSLVGLLAAAIHPYKQERFIATVAPALIVLAARGLAELVDQARDVAAEKGIQLSVRYARLLGVAAVLGLVALGLPSALARHAAGENERLSFATSAQQDLSGVVDLIAQEVDLRQPVLLIGSFNELSPAAIRWYLHQRTGTNPLVVGLPFPGRTPTEGLGPIDPAPYARALNEIALTRRGSTLVTIAITPESPFATQDYWRWNSWQEQYLAALPAIGSARRTASRDFEQAGLRVGVYRLE